MNSLTAEKQYQFAKWAEIIKSCKSSGMMVSEWLKQNNISKDQYYYWQRKLRDACLESLQAEQATFVELPVEVPQVCEHKPVIKKATIKASKAVIPEKNIVVAMVLRYNYGHEMLNRLYLSKRSSTLWQKIKDLIHQNLNSKLWNYTIKLVKV